MRKNRGEKKKRRRKSGARLQEDLHEATHHLPLLGLEVAVSLRELEAHRDEGLPRAKAKAGCGLPEPGSGRSMGWGRGWWAGEGMGGAGGDGGGRRGWGGPGGGGRRKVFFFEMLA